jgi:hypothetical protein
MEKIYEKRGKKEFCMCTKKVTSVYKNMETGEFPKNNHAEEAVNAEQGVMNCCFISIYY